MRLSLIKIVVFCCLCISFISCEKQIPWDYGNTPSKLVVSGIITDELKPFTVTLTETVNKPNDSVQYISGATVFIVSHADTVFLPETSIQGIYTSITFQRAVINKTYTLHVISDGIEYTATDNMVPITKAGAISYYQSSEDSSLFTLNFEEFSNKNQMFLYECNWESSNISVYSYSFHSLDVSQLFAPNTRKVYFPIGTKINRTQYSLSDNYAEYLRAVLLETKWNGGYFDENSAPITGNISHGALGYFGTCMVLRDTITVE